MFNNNEDISFDKIKQLVVPVTTIKAICILIILGVIIYANALFGEFIGDDIPQVVNNLYVHSLHYILFSFAHPVTFGIDTFRFYRPISYIAYVFIYFFFGQNTFFYHLSQILIHILNSSVIFLLFKKFFKKNISLLLAIIFLIHPINTESVAYIASLQIVLYFLFGILALSIVIFVDKLTVKHGVAICSLLILSLLAKESGILFIPIVITFAYSFKKKCVTFSLVVTSIALFIYAFLRYGVARQFYAFNSGFNLQILHTILLTSPKMFYFYISTFFFPKDLALGQLWLVNSLSLFDFYIPLFIDLLFLCLVSILGFYLWRKKRSEFLLFIFFVTWFIVGISVTFPLWLLDTTVGERWFYFPIIGLLGLFGLLWKNVHIQKTKTKKIGYIVLTILLSLLAVRSIIRNANWQTRLTLYSHDAPLAHSLLIDRSLINEYIRQGDFQSAKEQLNKTIILDPNNSINWFYKGIIDEQTGNFPQAEKDFLQLLHTSNDELGYEALPGILVSHDGNYSEAQKLLSSAVKKYPQNLAFWHALAVVNYKLGNLEEASYDAKRTHMSLQSVISNQ